MTDFAHLPHELRFAAEWLANELKHATRTGSAVNVNCRALTLSVNHASVILAALKRPQAAQEASDVAG